MAVRTDLHTHFAGILTPDELIDVGLEHDVSLDMPTAKRLGITGKSYDGGSIPLRQLSKDQMSKLKKGLALDLQKKSLFDELDGIYANRAFIMKDSALFVPLLEKIAQSYKNQGISYVELSYAGVISNPDLIKQIHQNMPRIEKETGVKLRFLGALWRHSDPEWNMDEADRLKNILKSPYVVGIDVMGHEKNPIRNLKKPIEEIVGYAARNIPGFSVRLHAGENPYYSADPSKLDDYNFNNAYEAVSISDQARRTADGNFYGEYGADIQIRLGHGRYGIQAQTLELMKKVGAISELCLTSNMLLNHADNYKGPFNLYAAMGINYVLGSDGYGMYSTTMPQETAAAIKAGMTAQAEHNLIKTETAVLLHEEHRFQKKMAIWDDYAQECSARKIDPFKVLGETPYSTADGKARWTPDVPSSKSAAIKQQHDKLIADIAAKGISVDEGEIKDLIHNRRITLFSGASKSSWKNVPEEQQRKVADEMRGYIQSLDGRRDVVVTGGTDYGFEAVVHRLIEERNKSLPEEARISVIGALTLEANPKDIRTGSLSHVMFLRYGKEYAMSWMDQSPALMDIVLNTDTKIIMAGGGQVIRDMIVDASGRGFIEQGKVFLFAGVNGASDEKSKEYPKAQFRSADELLKLMQGGTQPAPPRAEARQLASQMV